MNIDPSGPLHKARRTPFYPLQLPPSPLLVHHYWEGGPNGVTVKNLWVDDSRFIGWRLKWLGWWWLGWQLKMRTSSGVQTSNRLSGSIYAHDKCRSLIGFYLGSKRHFVFRALFLQIPESFLLISSFSAKTYCQSTTVILVKPTRSYCYIDRRHTRSVHLVYPSLIQKIW